MQELNKEFILAFPNVDQRRKRLNRRGKSFIISYSDDSYIFKSFYGDITECKTRSKIIDL